MNTTTAKRITIAQRLAAWPAFSLLFSPHKTTIVGNNCPMQRPRFTLTGGESSCRFTRPKVKNPSLIITTRTPRSLLARAGSRGTSEMPFSCDDCDNCRRIKALEKAVKALESRVDYLQVGQVE